MYKNKLDYMSNHKRRHSSLTATYDILKCKSLSKFSVKRIPCLFNKFFAPLYCIHVLCFDSLSKMSPPPPLSPPPLSTPLLTHTVKTKYMNTKQGCKDFDKQTWNRFNGKF